MSADSPKSSPDKSFSSTTTNSSGESHPFDFLFEDEPPRAVDASGDAADTHSTSDPGLFERRARDLLAHTWHAFFGRFGRLTDAQRLAIEPVARGESVILSAATASGKTEALLAPLIERCIQRSQPRAKTSERLRILIVCPTRALCNDFLRRVRQPVLTSQWSVDLKSGDNPSFNPKKPPNILITTPESLDSLLSRSPKGLKWVEALFIDEVHLLDGSPRGDHMRMLVARLKSFRPDLQVCCASATVPEIERIAQAFIQPRPDNAPTILQAGGGRDRQIDVDYIPYSKPSDAITCIEKICDNSPGIKLLVFANSRAEVEYIAAELSDLQKFPAFAHHGSLSKPERLRVEKGFLATGHGVCVATMTLELGIDIGDVDRVVLLNPPANVASFTQRIGRGNRRGGDLQVTCLYSQLFDRQRFEHQVECAEAGKLFHEPIAFRPAILPQQAISLLFQNPKRWLSADALHTRLPADVARDWTRADCRTILDLMGDVGLFHVDSAGRFVPEEKVLTLYQSGAMHTHIDSDPEIEVIDETTGRTIGRVDWSREEFSRRAHEAQRAGSLKYKYRKDKQPKDKKRKDKELKKNRPKNKQKPPTPRAPRISTPQGSDKQQKTGLLLGARNLQVTRVKKNKVYVESREKREEPSFVSRMGPNYSFDLAQDLARFIGLTPGVIYLHPRPGRKGKKYWFVEHFFGTIWGHLLAAVLERHDFSHSPGGLGPFFKIVGYEPIIPRKKPPETLGTAAQIKSIVLDSFDAYQKRLEKKLQAGPWRIYIPKEMTRRWLIQTTRPDEFANTLAAFRLEIVK